MFGSSVRIVPAAAFLGFTAGGSPCSSRSRFILKKASSGRITSPRTSKPCGSRARCNLSFETESGTDRMVRTLLVTSSPVTPSPRVRAVCNKALPAGPGSYCSASETPSIFNSHTKLTSALPMIDRTRRSQSASSCSLFTLSSESMGRE